jgi:hypothetical protein
MAVYTPPKIAPGTWAAIATGATTLSIIAAQGVREQSQRLAQATVDAAARRAWQEVTDTYQAGLEAAVMERDFYRACDEMQTERLRLARLEAARIR